MEKDVLVILMVAFGLFAIVMFVLFFVYLKKYYNSKHINDDYQKEGTEEYREDDLSDEAIWHEPPKDILKEAKPVSFAQEQSNLKEIVNDESESFEEFVPIKKK